MYLILIIILIFTSPVFAQDIPPDIINTRIQQLETEKTRLEEIYKEITVRIDELRQLIAPKQEKQPEKLVPEKPAPEKTDAN